MANLQDAEALRGSAKQSGFLGKGIIGIDGTCPAHAEVNQAEQSRAMAEDVLQVLVPPSDASIWTGDALASTRAIHCMSSKGALSTCLECRIYLITYKLHVSNL